MKKFLVILMVAFMSLTYTFASAKNYVDATGDKSRIEYVKVNMPAVIKLYEGDSIQVQIRTVDEYLRKNIHYRIDNEKKMINIWIENYNFEEVNSMDSKDIRIAIVAPEELKIQTSNNLLLTHCSYKKTSATGYENN